MREMAGIELGPGLVKSGKKKKVIELGPLKHALNNEGI